MPILPAPNTVYRGPGWLASSLMTARFLFLKPFPDVPGSSFASGRRGGELGCQSRYQAGTT